MEQDQHQITQVNYFFVSIVSGVFGVAIKNGLYQALSSQLEAPFRQIPANMLGCFLVGFFTNSNTSLQVVFDSVTSLAFWNQAMATSALNGNWFFALSSFITGLELAYISYKIGLDTGLMFHDAFGSSPEKEKKKKIFAEPSKFVAATSLWLLVAVLAVLDHPRRKLWLACLVAPLGAWTRHALSVKLNDHCKLELFPLGTLLANLLSSLATPGLLLVKITDPAAIVLVATVDAFQGGFVDSMATISTVMAEAHSLHKNSGKDKAWRAYLYVLLTMVTCFCVVVALVVALVAAITSIATKSFPAVANIQEFSSPNATTSSLFLA
ncbi:uncharacterized protein LOC112341324 [Selaginella moellendorffii]|uniref:uncharacterized protein LOC112341324 n=1 Tax=Selaginella moellendorffii TaxID=88036 RepID=UPI000D1C6F04|nr:uncharacterized protein LOC112341324 [Selaginella moellendorffii]|eukprot:XP_024517003.1 uncharacterized protein LOC112341324 [Selaginella moellendorffii]